MGFGALPPGPFDVSRMPVDPVPGDGPLPPAGPARRAAQQSRIGRLAKDWAWRAFGAGLVAARLACSGFGLTRRVDTIIYKVDRLGDWLLAEAAIGRIVAATRARGGTVVVWAARESAAIREWRRPDYRVEAFVLEPRGLLAKLRRALEVVHLLAVYRARSFICLRHSPEPVRDFALAHAAAPSIHALSWRIAPGPTAGVPHEIVRHNAILAGAGLEAANVRELLPRVSGWRGGSSRLVVLAPFSSAAIKDWRDDGWCSISSGLAGRGLVLEVWAGPDQKERAERLARRLSERLGSENVSVKSGTLERMAGAVASARLVLTVDTFAAHLATAMDAPMVCVIGGGQYGDFGPWQSSPRQRWVTHALPCFGCNWNCSRARVECLEDIEPKRVMAEIEAVLRLEPGTDNPRQ